MLDNGFIYGEKATWDFPICKVEKFPDIPSPVRRYETVSVPGRNGDLHVAEDAFNNITKSYECYFHADDFVAETSHTIKAWLLAGKGYQRLIDLYDQEHYFRAAILDAITMTNWMGKYSRFTVSFSCDPRAFLLMGDAAVPLPSSGGTLRNPTAFSARPLITVFGSGNGTLTVGDVSVGIKGLSGSLILDCEDMDAYSIGPGGPINQNSKISAPKFPALAPGANVITWTGGIQSVEITPRWWES